MLVLEFVVVDDASKICQDAGRGYLSCVCVHVRVANFKLIIHGFYMNCTQGIFEVLSHSTYQCGNKLPVQT